MTKTPPKPTVLSALWHCRLHGLERGPMTWDMLQSLAEAGDLRPSDLVRRDDSDQWIVASQARCADPDVDRLAHRTPAQGTAALTERMAANLADEVAAMHAPARPFRRQPVEMDAESQSAATAELAVQTAAGEVHEPVVAAGNPDHPEVPEETPVASNDDEAAQAPADRETAGDDSVTFVALGESPLAETPAAPPPTSSASATSTPTEPGLKPLPAAAIARAVRNAKPPNARGIALLALGLALIGIFKLALPLGLLAIYLAWTSAANLRRRPSHAGVGAGIAVAAGALIIGGIDVGVSVYTIVSRM